MIIRHAILVVIAFLFSTTAIQPSVASDYQNVIDKIREMAPESQPEITGNWLRLTVPGAYCGNGEPYVIFIGKSALTKDTTARSRKVSFLFKGGGACWDYETCFKYEWAKISPPEGAPEIADEGVYSDNPEENRFSEYSRIHLPYCTGDVFVGTHEGYYRDEEDASGEEHRVLHHGKLNFVQVTKWLQANNYLIDFEQTDEVLLYGFSAGSVGALYHVKTLDPLFESAQKKTLISDSPGLHFGDTFFTKFSAPYLDDFSNALKAFGYHMNKNSGLVAGFVPLLCQQYPHWNVGVLQSTQDFVMSEVFGDISSPDHVRLVLSSKGLPNITLAEDDNCVSWVEKGHTHTYLALGNTSNASIDGVSAMDFAWGISLGQIKRNFLGPATGVEQLTAQ